MKVINHQNQAIEYLQSSVKVIAGIDNFDIERIIKIIKASEIAGATYVDLAANVEIVSAIKSLTTLPICASSIDPLELYNCSLVGADVVEIGNFDVLYKKGITFSASQIFHLALEAKTIIDKKIQICVTIPHILSLNDQIKLSILLEKAGIDIIQTEGLISKIAAKFCNNDYICSNQKKFQDNVFRSINQATYSLSASYAIAQATHLPVVTSSGIMSISAPIAFHYGASGIGFRSAIADLQNMRQIIQYIYQIMNSISYAEYNSIDYLSTRIYLNNISFFYIKQ
uniref:Uncharacterized protein ycf23 n=1 Tax=Spyridia filamentosa TaxID=196632 RepID=A0A1Z1MJC5_SPYFI|nr:hypothetical protein [Spyridia filamentosa]ARW66158.1 hypothetical protein [Spyridia filamentosa]